MVCESDYFKFQMKEEALGVKPVYYTELRCTISKFKNNTLLLTDSLEKRNEHDVFFGVVLKNGEVDSFLEGYKTFSKKKKNKGISAAKYGYYLNHEESDRTGWILPEMLDMLEEISK